MSSQSFLPFLRGRPGTTPSAGQSTARGRHTTKETWKAVVSETDGGRMGIGWDMLTLNDIELLLKRSVLYWCWFYAGCWHLWISVSVVDSCWQGNALWIINLPWYKKLPRLLLVMTQIQWQFSCWFGFVFSRSFRKQRQYDNTCCAPRAIRVQPDPKPCANWVLFLWFLCTGPPVTQGQKSKRFVLPGDPKHPVWHLQIWIILNYHILSVFAQPSVQQTKPLLMDFGFEKSLNSSQLWKLDLFFDSMSMVANFGTARSRLHGAPWCTIS